MRILEKTEQLLFDCGIRVIHNASLGIKSFCIICDNVKYVAINKSEVSSNQELNTIYLHEFEHLQNSNLIYDFKTSKRIVRTIEGRTKRRLIKKLVKRDHLISMFKMGYEVHDIAEELCLTEDLIRSAIEMYNER